jgi:hypothetical protein
MVCNPIFAIPESNRNASKRVLGTRKDRTEICLWVVGIILRSHETKPRIEVKVDRVES